MKKTSFIFIEVLYNVESFFILFHKVNGRMIVPVGPDGGLQALYLVIRIFEERPFNESDFISDFEFKELMGVRYVPLVKS